MSAAPESAWESEAEATRRLAEGILAGLPLGMGRARRTVRIDAIDASVTRCTCGAWRFLGHRCTTCGARPVIAS